MNRKKAREYVFQLIFSYEFTKEVDVQSLELIKMDAELGEDDREYINNTLFRVIEHYDEIKCIIEKFAIGFTVDRIFKPDLAVMMLAIGEMKYSDDVPMGVAIAEAIAIIKKYSTTKSSSFVNGILASVYKELNK